VTFDVVCGSIVGCVGGGEKHCFDASVLNRTHCTWFVVRDCFLKPVKNTAFVCLSSVTYVGTSNEVLSVCPHIVL
jgi:hypothetical protein